MRPLPSCLLLAALWLAGLTPTAVRAQTQPAALAATVTLSGYLRDAATGEPLIGATVFEKRLKLGATADERGFFSLALPRGAHVITYSFVGYAPREERLTLSVNQERQVRLSSAGVQTGEVLVTGSRAAANVQGTQMGVNQLDMKAIKLVPALLGEVDVVRTIQLLPGISTVGEGATGFNVRGGNIDQNLVLLDDAPIYNSSHLFGFFSVFNPDAVKDLTLVKGGIPASYGGRLSSVLDVRMRAGNPDSLAVSGGLGLVSSRLAVEVPLIKNKLTVLAAARRSYADLFLKAVPSQKDNVANFSDLSVKLHYRLGARDQLALTGYRGRDVFNFGQEFQTNYGNATGTLRYTRTGERLTLHLTALSARYDTGLGTPGGGQAFRYATTIQNYTAKADLGYQLGPRSHLGAGAASTWYEVAPGQLTPLSANSIYRPLAVPTQRGRELAAYLDHELDLTPALSVRYGLRVSAFQYLGAATVRDYAGPDGVEKTPVGTSRAYAAGAVVANYPNLEPRLSVRLGLSETSSLKASYNRMAQYLHLLSNTTAASPFDSWTLSTANVRPERADQLALGYFRNFQNNAYEASVEVFGKRLTNQIDFVDGANLLLNQDLEGSLLYGRGRAYGAELYVRKNTGRLTGWLAYTLSHSERQIAGINNGRWYDTKFDKRNVLAVVGIYQLSARWSLSGTFNYSTGVAATVPDARFVYQGLVVPNLTDNARNNYRVPAYHRLDLAATLQGRRRPGARFSSSWVFSVYNLYARRNAYSIYFRQSEKDPGQTEAVRLSILGSVLPSVTYNFNF